MTDHEWRDDGPVQAGSPARGRYWSCGRCGLKVRSNREPLPDRASVGGVVYVTAPGGPLPAGRRDRYPTDCDLKIAMGVMGT